MILITNKGAKSGTERVTLLVYSVDGDDYVIIASMGGAPTSPDWYHNLVANPGVTVEVGTERFQGTASEVRGPERDRLYEAQAEILSMFTEYAAKTTRVIPVFRISRVSVAGAGLWSTFWRYLRIVLVAGVPTGVLVGGVGSRAAMFLLRLTSDNSVRGLISDDGFTIGRFSPRDSYGLLQLGAIVGVIGALLYLAIRGWLLGPRWFRTLTIGLGCGAVVGSMLLHSSGVDFLVLSPRWLAMALFVALPAFFGMVIGPAVEFVERRPLPKGWRQFVAPALALALGPSAVFALIVVAPGTFVYAAVRSVAVQAVQGPAAIRVIVRAGWLAVAVLGLAALLRDVRSISALP